MSKPKLLITDGLSNDGLQALESSGLFEVSFHKSVEKDALVTMLATAEALIIRSATKMTKELLDAAHAICPYSVATRGNVPVTLEVV